MDKIWNDTIEGVRQIFEKNALNRSAYMKYHANVYIYLTVTDDLVEKSKYPESRINDQIEQTKMRGQKLYDYLKYFLESHVSKISLTEICSAEDILKLYNSEWSYYKFSSVVLNSIFIYFNHTWLKRKLSMDPGKVVKLNELVLSIWTSHFLEKFVERISGAAYELIERERMGEQIAENLILDLSNSFRNLDKNLTIYNKHFANKFLEETERFYLREGTKYLDTNTMTEYAAKVYEWLQKENCRADLYLHETTKKPLLKVFKKVLIENHIKLFYEEFQQLLNSNKTSNLGLLYYLVVRISECGFQELVSILKQHIKLQGLLALEKCCKSAQNDPKLYVSTLFQVYTKYHTIISNEFEKNTVFIAALDQAFNDFVNKNAVTAITKSSRKSSELIAKHCDALLKKSNKISEEDELDDALNQVITLFKYIEDKDVFQIFYSQFLAKRLVQQLSSSDDAEISMINKLKETLGCDYTLKFQKMIQDVELSKDLSQEFRTHVANSKEPLDFDFNIQVLSFGSWPYQKCSPVILPLEYEKAVGRFEEFYSKKHSGKKLHWLYNVSIGELTMRSCKSKYTITGNTLQIIILTQFNQVETLTIGQLTENTSIETDIVVQIVQILLKAKLVTCTDAEKDLSKDSVITINNSYKNKRFRININVPMKIESKVDQERTHQQIEMDRRNIAQAAIVRIMKSRKSLGHQQLIGEVLKQVERKFKPEVSLIKKCIDILMEKEYLERSAENSSIYNYLA